MKISVDDMMGELEIDTQKLFKYIRACYNPEDVFTVEELQQWDRTEYRDAIILKLRAVIHQKNKLIEEAGNALYVDQDGIGNLDEARRLIAEALKEGER